MLRARLSGGKDGPGLPSCRSRETCPTRPWGRGQRAAPLLAPARTASAPAPPLRYGHSARY